MFTSPQSIADKIIEALVANLQAEASGGVNGVSVTIERSRRRPTETAELPLITLRFRKELIENAVSGAQVKRGCHIVCTIRATGTDANLEPLRTFAIAVILKDRTVGGLTYDIQEIEHDWGGAEGSDADYTQDQFMFVAWYQTARNSTASKQPIQL